MRKAIFLDRDGTLNEDTLYPHKIEHFKLLPGVIEGLKKLSKDYIFIIITNQSGIGRGIYTEEDFHNFNNHLVLKLKKEGIEIKKTYYCPHHPDEDCDCRKPHTKNIKDAAREFNIDIGDSWTIGDHTPDIKMGLDAGTKTIFMLTGHGKQHIDEIKGSLKPDYIAENFLQAAEFILKNDKK
ncbi:HAD family hydrolase [Candidatus Woesearchaeota archaeon]|nr:HAD family hydrolase [Candidatus Woesearchaeota archaeon]